MISPKKLAAAAFLALFIHTSAWAIDKTDFQTVTSSADEWIFGAFRGVSLYYLESPQGTTGLVTKVTGPGGESREAIHFFLNRRAAENFRNGNALKGGIKKISMHSVINEAYNRSKSSEPSPEILISPDGTSKETSYFYLTETFSGKPYTLEFKKKKIIPAFVSVENALQLSRIITASGPMGTNVNKNTFSEFLVFLKERRKEGLPVRVFSESAGPRHTEVRPMTWGVGSSYLFGTVLVLFLLWAITRGSKQK